MSRSHLFVTVLLISAFSFIAQGSEMNLGFALDEYPQLEAQSICSSESIPSAGWVSAVPRECPSNTSCDTICKSIPLHAPDEQRRKARNHVCLSSYHVYNDAFSTKLHYPGLKTYKYQGNSCSVTGCGPNFCCCLSYS